MAKQERRDAEQKKLENVLNDDLKQVFCSPAGHRVLFHLFGICNLGGLSFTPDSLGTAFNEGRRSVGIELLSLLEEVDTDIYFKVLKEGGRVNG